MSRANVLINNLNTGEVSELIESRSDLSKYAAACKTLENAMPLVEGGAKKMPGTYFAGGAANGGAMFTALITGTTLQVSQVYYGIIQVNQILYYSGGTLVILAEGTGTGGAGTYTVSASLTIPSELMQTASSGKSRLVPFQFSTIQGAVLEFAAGIIRVWEGASEGVWSLGVAVTSQATNNYSPSVAYVPGNLVLQGSYFASAQKVGGTYTGSLFVTAPYGQNVPPSTIVSYSVNSTNALSVTITGTSPNQGINIALANTTPANNAASLIQAAIRALGSLNSSVYNYVSLANWTVTPDPLYYATPWITAPTTNYGQEIANNTWACATANQFDQFPFQINSTSLGIQPNPDWMIDDSAGTPIELATPYLEGDLFALDCSTQSADVLWVFHPNYPPAVVERMGPNLWQYSLSLPGQEPGEPAYRGTLDVVQTGYSALGQNISLISQAYPCIIVLATSGPPPFSNGSRIYINECSGLVELNEGEFLVSAIGYGTPEINVIDASGTATTITPASPVWYFTPQNPDTGADINSSSFLQYQGGGFAVQVVALFNSAGNYPSCGALYQERLCVGGSDLNPTQINGSVEDDYPDFISDPNEDDYAFQFTLVSSQVNQLLNMVGTPNGLAIGTSGGVWIVTGGTGASISQTSVNAQQQTTQGVSQLQPQIVAGSAVFVSRSARIVTFLQYSFVTNQWENTDLTRLNRNITIGTSAATSGIAQTAFQVEPYPIFWAVRNDGQLIGLVFNTQDQVYAWFRVNMLPQGGIIESVAVISGQNQEDQVVVVVNRTINGITQRYVEYFMQQELFHQITNGFFVNSGLQFQGVGPFNIAYISQSNPCVVTAPGHTLQNGMSVAIAGVQGMTQANTTPLLAWTVTGVSGDTFELLGIDSTIWSPYTSGGTCEQVTNQLTGMSYLTGLTVVAIGDQQVIFEGPVPPGDVVNFGSYANFITIGLPYKTVIQPLNPILGDQKSTSKGQKQKFRRATISLYESVGGLIGTDWGHLYPIDYGSNSMGNPPTLFTGNLTQDLDADWTDEDTILIVHGEPYPFTLRAVVPRLDASEGG